jgi:hypothetical protein
MMNGRERESLDRYITGDYGERRSRKLTAIAIFGLVVADLRVLNFEATFEFPGYIKLDFGEAHFCFGTANGTWGWNDEDGNGGDLEVGPDAPVAYVVEAIVELLERMAS